MVSSTSHNRTAPESDSTANGDVIHGVVSLLLTPFNEDRSVDWSAYDRYVDWQLSFKPAGLFAVCGSSEMAWLSLKERLDLARRAVAFSGDTPVIATANLAASRHEHKDEVARMLDTGVDGIVLIPRAELVNDPERYVTYFLEMIEQSDGKAFLYEWPHIPGHLFDLDVYEQLAPHIRGIKDTTCTPEGISEKIGVSDVAAIYQANTAYLPDSMSMGAHGYMAITSTCFPDLAIDTWNAITSGNKTEAKRLHRELVFLDNLLVRSYPQIAKVMVSRRGIDMARTTRWPCEYRPEFDRAVEAWFTRQN